MIKHQLLPAIQIMCLLDWIDIKYIYKGSMKCSNYVVDKQIVIRKCTSTNLFEKNFMEFVLQCQENKMSMDDNINET